MTEGIASSMTAAVCSYCGKRFDVDQLLTVCDGCGKVLLVEYDLDAARATMTPDALRDRGWDLWRYAELMPVRRSEHRLTLGEGGTPLLTTTRLGIELGLPKLLVKDEGRNPTGSFKARGLGAAVSRARELGVRSIALPSAGNAAAAACAYSARGAMESIVFMPEDAPPHIQG